MGVGHLIGLTDEDVRALGDGRAVVREGFLGALADEVRAATVALRDAGALTPAGTGRDGIHGHAVRGDRTAWVDDRVHDPPWDALWRAFDTLRSEVNAAAWLGLRRFTVQIAYYPGDGSTYARHLDALAGEGSRRLTAIVYLDPGWRPEDGGALRIYEPDGPRDLAPLHDRLVLFLSGALDHEVLPVVAERFAVTAWFGPDT